MWGQWLGRITGTNQGTVTLSIDKDRPWKGMVLVLDDADNRSSHIWNAEFKTKDDERNSITADLTNPVPYDKNYFLTVNLPEDEILPSKAYLEGKNENDVISGTWNTDIGTNDNFTLIKYENSELTKADHIFNSTVPSSQ